MKFNLEVCGYKKIMLQVKHETHSISTIIILTSSSQASGRRLRQGREWLFKDIYSGIKAVQSSLLVKISDFTDLKNNNVIPAEKGIGIIAENLTSTPRTLEVNSRFSNLKTGILTLGNIDAEIFQNVPAHYIRDIDDIGISINSLNYANDITIHDLKHFERCNIGIKISGSNLNSVIISNNIFTNSDFVETSTSSFHNTAITIQGTTTTGGAVEVYNNHITDYRIGIHAINIDNIRIGGYDNATPNPNARPNTIEYHLGNTQLADAFHGICIQNSNKADILVNSISNNLRTSESNLRGIVVENSNDANLGCNNLTNMGRAIRFQGLCMGLTSVLENNMTDYELGVELNLAQIPPQGANGNPWDNQWVNAVVTKSKIDGVTLIPNQPIDWYFQGTDGDVNNPLVPSPRGTGLINPFDSQPPGSATCANSYRIGSFDRDLSWGPIVKDTVSYLIDYADELSYLFRQYVYDQLSLTDSLVTLGSANDSLFQSFFNHMDSTNTGRFGEVVAAIDSSMMDTAAVLVDAITGINTIESNRKLVFSILTNKVLVDSIISSSDTISLENVASLHWLYTGKAVYNAAAVLGYEYHSPEIGLRQQNSQIHTQQTTETPIRSTIPVSIYPNPTGSIAYIVVETTKSYRLELYDVYNKLIQVQENNPVLDVSTLVEGIFFVHVIIEQQVIHSGKIVVIK